MPKKEEKPHGRRAMVREENRWAAAKFEFDGEDGRGVVWQRGRSTNSVEKSTGLFKQKGYTIVEWQDDV